MQNITPQSNFKMSLSVCKIRTTSHATALALLNPFYVLINSLRKSAPRHEETEVLLHPSCTDLNGNIYHFIPVVAIHTSEDFTSFVLGWWMGTIHTHF